MESVFTGKKVRERPEWMYSFGGNSTCQLLMGKVIQGEKGVSQNLPDIIIPNGAAYATRRNELMEKELIISSKTGCYIMSDERSVDIDEPLDFEYAEFLAKKIFTNEKN